MPPARRKAAAKGEAQAANASSGASGAASSSSAAPASGASPATASVAFRGGRPGAWSTLVGLWCTLVGISAQAGKWSAVQTLREGLHASVNATWLEAVDAGLDVEKSDLEVNLRGIGRYLSRDFAPLRELDPAVCMLFGLMVASALFLAAATTFAAYRMGRARVLSTSLLFGVASGLAEGIAQLTLFDVARTTLNGYLEPEWAAAPLPAGTNAVEALGLDSRRIWREFLFGGGVATIAAVALFACVTEPRGLPEYVDLDSPDRLAKARTLAEVSGLVYYWATGGVVPFLASRVLRETLVALAVGLPPPGAALAPARLTDTEEARSDRARARRQGITAGPSA